MKKRVLIILAFALLSIKSEKVIAQEAGIIPPLPESAAFFKSTDVPVSLYTGVPNISIPLYTIQLKEMQIPITLNYNSRGIQVAEMASRVGLGWALQYGGMISRQIRGKADDNSYGILHQDYYNDIFTSRLKQASLDYMIRTHDIDQVPDQFFFGINGESGKFIIDHNDKKILLQKFDDMKIEANTTVSAITSWIVTDKMGNKYYYGKSKDGAREANDFNFIRKNYSFGQFSGLKQLDINEDRWITTWHLMEIETYLNEKVEFFYISEDGYKYSRAYDEVHDDGIRKELRANFSYDIDHQYQISEIRFAEGSVVFEPDAATRLDYSNTNSLKRILVNDDNAKIMKKYELNYSYQQSLNDDNQLYYLKQIDSTAQYRLFLNNIIESNRYGNTLPPYIFNYSNVILPNRFSNSIDHWGYYNGKKNGNFLTFYNSGTPNNREVDTSKSGAGLLSSITYPTGGSTKFIYEQNQIIPVPFIDNLIFNRNNSTKTSIVGSALFMDSIYLHDGIYSKEIIIGDDLKENTNVTFTFVPPYVPPGADSSITFYQVYLEGNNSQAYLYPPDTEKELNLTPGAYTLKVIPTAAHDPNNPNRAFIAGLHWTIFDNNADSLPDGEWYGAGKRIKKIENWISDSLVKTKEYEYLEDSVGTSGKMIGLPNYFWISKDYGLGPVAEGYGSVPGSPLSQMQGNALGYSKVTEYVGCKLSNSGKIIYEFTDDSDGGQYYRMPYHLPVDFEWLRGMPLSTKIYENHDGTYELQKNIENKYLYAGNFSQANIFSQPFINSDSGYTYQKGRNLFYLPLFTFAPCPYPFHLDSPLCFKVYYQTGGTVDLKSTTETLYSKGNIISTKTEYGYNYEKHYLPTSEKTTTGKGEEKITSYVYLPDLYFKTPAEVTMQSLNRIALPVETETVVKNNVGNELSKVVQKTINNQWGGGLVLPQFIKSIINLSPETIGIEFNSYSRAGSPTEITLKSGIKEVYLWGYNNKYAVAKITGSDYNTTSAFIDTAMLQNASQYSDVQLRTELNKIRTGLSGTPAQVFTYTYKPLIGISSVTDHNNQTMYYEYDDYARLIIIKDKDNNVVKRICYNYEGQAEDCSSGCIADWQSTGNNRCLKDGNNNNTGFQEKEIKDLKPCSSTYGQLRWIAAGTNLAACPLPYICSTGNCTGEDKKCIDNNCETGLKIFTASFDQGNRSYCTYHYEWSDGSWSQNYTVEIPFGFRCALN